MNGDAKFAYDVFLGHNAQDKPRGRRLEERLLPKLLSGEFSVTTAKEAAHA